MNNNTEDFKDIPDVEMLRIIESLADLISGEVKRRQWRGLSMSFGDIQIAARQMMSEKRVPPVSRSLNASL